MSFVHITLHNSPQKGSSIANVNIAQNSIQTQSQQTPPTRQTILRTPPYTPAQTSNTKQPVFTINKIHTYPQLTPSTSRTLSRPPSTTFTNNPLTYNLTSADMNNIQQLYHSSVPHTQSTSLPMNSLSTAHSSNHSQHSQNPSTMIRSNPRPRDNTFSTLPLSNTHHKPHNSNNKYQTNFCSTLLLSIVSNPTYIYIFICLSF